METTTIFRLEHPVLKCGPWNTHVHPDFYDHPPELRCALQDARCALNRHFHSDDAYSNKHPSAGFDIRGFTTKHQCATQSIELLREWFAVNGDIVFLLERAGFTALELTVPKSKLLSSKSGTQVGYHPDNVVSCRDIGIVALKG